MSYLGVWRISAMFVAATVVAGCGDNIVASPLLKVTAGDSLTTTEGGGSATFTVGLTEPPSSPVTIDLASSRTTEGDVSPSSVTLTFENYDPGVMVTVTGVDDAVADGDQDYAIHLDGGRIGSADIPFKNMDDDVIGPTAVQVTPTTGLATAESGTTATFTVVLTTAPTANVTIPLSSTRTSEGTVSTASLVFTPANWDQPQTVTVTGVDDSIDDGNQAYSAILDPATSADTRFTGVNPSDVALTNTDNDTRGVMVTPVSGLETSETGTSATFTMALTSEPTADVTITVATGDATEGTVAQTSLTFTPINWNAPRTIVVTGVNDSEADGDRTYNVITAPATSTDTGYAGLDPANVAVTNIDDDTAGVVVTAAATGLVTNESGLTASFTIVLRSQPSAAVTIPVASNDPTEGVTNVSSVTFTTLDWNAPQEVFVAGQNDNLADGPINYTVLVGSSTSTDATYTGIDPADVAAVNLDNDSAGILVTPLVVQTSENLTSEVFTVVLLSQPTQPVVVPVASSNPAEGTVTPATLTFTAANWDQAQSVTVTGVNDLIADGAQVYTVILAPAVSGDAGYSGVDATDVTATNVDNDSAGVTVDPIDQLFVSEFGDTDFFDVVLNSMPTAPVTIPLSSNDTTEGTVSPASLTFTSANWNIPQTVTITGVDDTLVDGNVLFSIITGLTVSADPAFNGVNPPDATVTNVDNETPNVFVKARKRLFTRENGGTATFRVRLTTNPTASVTCTLQSADTTEGVVSPTTLVFGPGNFGFQTVTISGVDDQVRDGDVLYTIILNACTSADNAYNGLDPRDVTAINRDND